MIASIMHLNAKGIIWMREHATELILTVGSKHIVPAKRYKPRVMSRNSTLLQCISAEII